MGARTEGLDEGRYTMQDRELNEGRDTMQDRELLGRVASLVCDEDEVSLDDVRANLAACIDQTLLDPAAGPEAVAAWARANALSGFAALRVFPSDVGRVAWELDQLGSDTPVCCALSFPYGRDYSDSLCFSTAIALASGASEVELAMNLGAFVEGSLADVVEPVQSVRQTIDADDDAADGDEDGCGDGGGCDCGHYHGRGHGEHDCCGCDDDCDCGHDHGEEEGAGEDCCGHDHGEHDHGCGPQAALKVAIETGYLTAEQVCSASDVVSSLGVDFVVAGTGFGLRDASVEDVRLMCATVEPGVHVEAAGAFRTLAGVVALLEAGAVQIGTPFGAEILAEFDALAAGLAVSFQEADRVEG